MTALTTGGVSTLALVVGAASVGAVVGAVATVAWHRARRNSQPSAPSSLAGGGQAKHVARGSGDSASSLGVSTLPPSHGASTQERAGEAGALTPAVLRRQPSAASSVASTYDHIDGAEELAWQRTPRARRDVPYQKGGEVAHAKLMLQEGTAASHAAAHMHALMSASHHRRAKPRRTPSGASQGPRRMSQAVGYTRVQERMALHSTLLGASRLINTFEAIATIDPGHDPNSLSFAEFRTCVLERLRIDVHEAELLRVWDGLTSNMAHKPVTQRDLTFDDFAALARRSTFLQQVIAATLSAAVREFKPPPDYDYTKSTNDNYRSTSPEPKFYGEFQDIRRTRDYSYHVVHTKARQLWQDGVVKSVVHRTEPQVGVCSVRPYSLPVTPCSCYCRTPGEAMGGVHMWRHGSRQGLHPGMDVVAWVLSARKHRTCGP